MTAAPPSAGGPEPGAPHGVPPARPAGDPGVRPGDAATAPGSGPPPGPTVTHRRYVPYSHAHYGGDLVDGAYVLAMFGDVATEVCIRDGGDEGLFASYDDVQFRAPVRAGDVLEATARVVRAGRRSRRLEFEARVVCRARPDRGASAAEVLAEPIIVVTATGTVVLPHSGT